MSDWGRHDYAGVLAFAGREWAGRPLHVIGHSVGGQILGHAAGTRTAQRIVTVSSQFGTWMLWPTPHNLAFAGLWHVLMPAVTRAWGYLPGRLGIGEDLPRDVALEWARWCRSRRYFFDHGVSPAGFAAVRAHLLAFSLDDDTYAPRAAVDALHSYFTGARLDRRHVAPRDVGARAIGHFGFFRSEFRETLWRQVATHLLGSGQPAVSAPA
jgi:predicted alpha/beta hydrolase